MKLQQRLSELESTLQQAKVDPDTIHLKVTLEKRKKGVRAALALATPSGVLRCSETDPETMVAFEHSLRQLTRELLLLAGRPLLPAPVQMPEEAPVPTVVQQVATAAV